MYLVGVDRTTPGPDCLWKGGSVLSASKWC